MKNNEIKIGATYKHYKGKEYKVLGFAKHSESLEELVYYKCLYNNDQGQFWVRPKHLFLSLVDLGGIKTERFKLVKSSFHLGKL